MRVSDIVYVVSKIGEQKFLEVEVQVGMTGPGKQSSDIFLQGTVVRQSANMKKTFNVISKF